MNDRGPLFACLRIGKYALDAEAASKAVRAAKCAYWAKIAEYEEEVRTLGEPLNCSHEDAHAYTRVEYDFYKECKRTHTKMKRRLQTACAKVLK